MISDNFTNMSANPSLTEMSCALNNSFDGVYSFSILIALVFIFGFAIYSWNRRDPFGSFVYGLSLVTTLSFFLTLTNAVNCSRLLAFSQFIFFLVLTVLGFIMKRVMD